MLEGLDQWLEPWYRSIWQGIYLSQEQACRDALARSRNALSLHDGSDDECKSLDLYLAFLGHQSEFYFRQGGDGADVLHDAIGELSRRPADGPLCSAMQSRVLLALCCFAHARGALNLAQHDVALWLSRVPESDMDHQTWNYVSFWAFDTGKLAYLTDAYRYYLTRPVDFMVDFSRQRIKVMLALSEGRCLRSDLMKMIELMPNHLHSDWFRWFLQPVCAAQGLWDDEVRSFAGKRDEELKRNPSVPPTTGIRERLRGNL